MTELMWAPPAGTPVVLPDTDLPEEAPRARYRPTASGAAAPAVELDLTGPDPAYALGVMWGGFVGVLGSLGWALWCRHTGDPAGVDLGVRLASAGFLVAAVAAVLYRRWSRRQGVV